MSGSALGESRQIRNVDMVKQELLHRAEHVCRHLLLAVSGMVISGIAESSRGARP